MTALTNSAASRAQAASSWLAREWTLVLVLSLAAVSRLLWLDADAHPFKTFSDVGDEGRWWHAARVTALAGGPIYGAPTTGWAAWTSPLYTVLTWLAFQAGGPSFYLGRLPSALSSLATLALLYHVVSRSDGRRAGLAAAILLGLNVHYFAYNRLGLVETMRLLLVLGSLWAWLAPEGGRPVLSAVLSGVLAAAVMLAKIFPDFIYFPAALWLIEWLRGGDVRRRRLAAFTGVFVLGGLALAGAYFRSWGADPRGLAGGLFVFDLITIWDEPAHVPFLPITALTNEVLGTLPAYLLLLLALPALAADLARLVAAPRQGLREMPPAGRLAWALVLACLAIGVTLDYGDRRMFPWLVPLAIFAARSVVWPARWPLVSQVVWPERRVLAVVAVTGWMWLAWWKAVSTNPWPDFSARWWLAWAGAAAVIGAGMLALYGAHRRAWDRDARGVLAALLLTWLFTLTDQVLFRLTGDFLGLEPARWAIAAAAAGLAAGLGWGYARQASGRGGRQWSLALGAVYVAFGVAAIGQQALRPTFTTRDASRRLAEILPQQGQLFMGHAEELCTEVPQPCNLMDSDRRMRPALEAAETRVFWLSGPDDARISGPAGAPCLLTEDQRASLASLTEVERFELTQGVQRVPLVLYELSDPAANGCR
jgi:4-amino-4-deoxy-L-arabinose transferase-like glycosyltransferase